MLTFLPPNCEKSDFLFFGWRQRKGSEKKPKRAAFIKSKQNPPHNIILEILIKLPTSTGLPARRELQLGTVKGDLLQEQSYSVGFQVVPTRPAPLTLSNRSGLTLRGQKISSIHI
jgi:hypothetical protein